MIAALLPVKRFAESKQRLATWLGASQREELARAMFEDVWEKLTEWQDSRNGAVRLLVITAERLVIERCRREAIPCLVETSPVSHSDSTRRATAWAIEQGMKTLISVPIDAPAVTAAELSELAELSRHFQVIVVPSSDGAGTNALVRTPPDAIAPRFGPGSCRRHVEEAKASQLSHCRISLPGLTADIDTPEDAERFLALARSLGRSCRTARLLAQFQETFSRIAACP